MAQPKKNPVLFYGLKGVIALLSGFLVWTTVGTVSAGKVDSDQVSLTRAKMKVLLDLQKAYYQSDSLYADNIRTLFEFANQRKRTAVADTIFEPVLRAMKRSAVYHDHVKDVTLSEFRDNFFESLIDNPMTNDKFAMSVSTVGNRKVITIRAAASDEENERVGFVKNGSVTWNEKLELLNR